MDKDLLVLRQLIAFQAEIVDLLLQHLDLGGEALLLDLEILSVLLLPLS